MRRFTRGFLVPFLLLAIPLGILASLGYLAAHRQLARARDAAIARTAEAVTLLVADYQDSLRRETLLLARDPAVMERFADEMRAAFAPGTLDPLTKELVYLAVSIANQCDYCIASHGAMARAKGLSDEMHEEFMAVVLAAQKGNKRAMAYRVPVDQAFEES